MKKQIITLTTVSFLLFTLLIVAFVFTNDANAQEAKSQAGKVVIEKYELPGNAVKSLIQGIQSENMGLRRSAIFYAGQYRLEATVDCLIEELQKENDPATKILIALSLYKIGDPIAIEHIKNMVNNESNSKVKRMFTAIYNEYVIEKSLATVSK